MTSDHEERATAREETFRRFYPSLYRALVAVLLDGELARDALQEAFVQGPHRPGPDSASARHRMDPAARPSAWARVARGGTRPCGHHRGRGLARRGSGASRGQGLG